MIWNELVVYRNMDNRIPPGNRIKWVRMLMRNRISFNIKLFRATIRYGFTLP
jgi:hypothetical protein